MISNLESPSPLSKNKASTDEKVTIETIGEKEKEFVDIDGVNQNSLFIVPRTEPSIFLASLTQD